MRTTPEEHDQLARFATYLHRRERTDCSRQTSRSTARTDSGLGTSGEPGTKPQELSPASRGAGPCFCDSALQGKGVTCSRINLTPKGCDVGKKQHPVMSKNIILERSYRLHRLSTFVIGVSVKMRSKRLKNTNDRLTSRKPFEGPRFYSPDSKPNASRNGVFTLVPSDAGAMTVTSVSSKASCLTSSRRRDIAAYVVCVVLI